MITSSEYAFSKLKYLNDVILTLTFCNGLIIVIM